MKTMLFDPYTGTPRHPSDIASDPEGILILDPDEPLRAALPERKPMHEAEIKAEIDAALDRAAEVCETILDELSFANAYECANECAEAIRALKESKE